MGIYIYIYIYISSHIFNRELIDKSAVNEFVTYGITSPFYTCKRFRTLLKSPKKSCVKKNDILRHMNSASFKFTHSIITKANAGDEINKGQIFLCTGISTGNLWYVHVFLHMPTVCYYWGMKKNPYTFFGKLELDFLIE